MAKPKKSALEAGAPPEQPAAPLGGAGAPEAEHNTPRAADPGGPVPREVAGLDRVPAGSGLRRFKIRCDNYEGRKARYILARDEAEARDCFLDVSGIAARLEELRAELNEGETLEKPRLAVARLAD